MKMTTNSCKLSRRQQDRRRRSLTNACPPRMVMSNETNFWSTPNTSQSVEATITSDKLRCRHERAKFQHGLRMYSSSTSGPESEGSTESIDVEEDC